MYGTINGTNSNRKQVAGVQRKPPVGDGTQPKSTYGPSNPYDDEKQVTGRTTETVNELAMPSMGRRGGKRPRAHGPVTGTGRATGNPRDSSSSSRSSTQKGAVVSALIADLEQLQGEKDGFSDLVDDLKSELTELSSNGNPGGNAVGAQTQTVTHNIELVEVSEADASFDKYRGVVRLGLSAVNYEEGEVSKLRRRVSSYMVRANIEATEANVSKCIKVFDELANAIPDEHSLYKGWLARWWHKSGIQTPLRAMAVKAGLGLTALVGAVTLIKRNRKLVASILLAGYGVLSYVISERKPEGRWQFKMLDDTCTGERWASIDIERRAQLRTPTHFKCIPHSYPQLFGVAGSEIVCARGCTHNELTALVTRVLTPAVSTSAVRKHLWSQAMGGFKQHLGWPKSVGDLAEELTLGQFVKRYSQARGKQIVDAYERMVTTALPPDPTTRGFVKREWLGKDPTKFKPRFISGKTEEYLATVGPEYYTLQKQLSSKFFGLDSKYVYTGGMSGEEVGGLVSNLEAKGYRFAENDMSSYDGHTEVEAIDEEMNCYEGLLPEDVMNSLRKQARCDGSTMSGVKYKCPGKFCSGVINTSFGNTLRNFAMHDYALTQMGLEDFILIALGDDIVIAYKGPLGEGDRECLQNTFTGFGHVANFVFREDVDFLEFCSMRFWRVGNTRVMGPKPFRVLSKMAVKDPSVKPADLIPYLRGILASYKYDMFVPVLGEVLTRLKETVGQGKVIRAKEFAEKVRARQSHVADEATWEQFTKVYGLTADEVIVMLDQSNIIPGGELRTEYATYGAITDGMHVPAYLPYSGTQPTLVCVEPNPGPFVPVAKQRKQARTAADRVVEIITEQLLDDDECKRCEMCGADLQADLDRLCKKRKPELVGIETNPGPSKRARKSRGKGKTQQEPRQEMSVSGLLKLLGKAALTSGGGALGGFLGGPAGSAVGAKVGAGVSRVVGFGDYHIKANSIVKGVQGSSPVTLSFQGADRGLRVRHRVYLGDVTGSSAFSITKIPINPGLSESFPWFSQVANMFECWKVHGLIYEFRSTSAAALNSTNTALGAVLLATQSNPYRAEFSDKVEMANHDMVSTGSPVDQIIHGVECDPAELPTRLLYVRNNGVQDEQDKRLYDLGDFYIATVGMQAAAVIGELWCEFDIELLKPRFDGTGSGALTYHITNAAYTNTEIFGPVQTTGTGSLAMAITATGAGYDTIEFPTWVANGDFMVILTWQGTSAAITLPTLTYTNCAVVTESNLFNASTYFTVGATSSKVAVILPVRVSASGATIQLSAAVLPTSGTYVSVNIVSLDDSIYTSL